MIFWAVLAAEVLFFKQGSVNAPIMAAITSGLFFLSWVCLVFVAIRGRAARVARKGIMSRTAVVDYHHWWVVLLTRTIILASVMAWMTIERVGGTLRPTWFLVTCIILGVLAFVTFFIPRYFITGFEHKGQHQRFVYTFVVAYHVFLFAGGTLFAMKFLPS